MTVAKEFASRAPRGIKRRLLAADNSSHDWAPPVVRKDGMGGVMTDRNRVAYSPRGRPFHRSGLIPHRSAPMYLPLRRAGFAGSARSCGFLWQPSEAASGEAS